MLKPTGPARWNGLLVFSLLVFSLCTLCVGCLPSRTSQRANVWSLDDSGKPGTAVTSNVRGDGPTTSTETPSLSENSATHGRDRVRSAGYEAEDSPFSEIDKAGWVPVRKSLTEERSPESEFEAAVPAIATVERGDATSPDLEIRPGMGDREAVLIDFQDVLSAASGQNPQVNFANQRIREAFAQLDQAELLWLPSLRAGMNYHYHNGKVQNARGEVLDISRNAFYGGMASRVVGGGAVGVPGVWSQFRLADAVYEPRVAEQTTLARRSAAEATLNDTLLDVALAYLQLLQRAQEQAIALETLENATKLAKLCQDYAEAGLSPPADANRVNAERALRENLVQRAREEVEVASTELVRLMSGDPTVLLVPREISVVPIELVGHQMPVRDLVATGLAHRPELRENQALVCEALERLNREKYSPLLPSVLLGMSYGAMGGGQGGHTSQFGDRVDFDVAVWWELRQLGLGERAIRDANDSRVEQARWQQVRMMDSVAQEVAAAHVQVRARKSQIEVARAGLQQAIESHRRNMDRIRQGEGLPIEALQSIQALDAVRRDFLRAVIEYNQAQFRLYRAVGWRIDESATGLTEPAVPLPE